jgi:hypothetical protein
MNPDETKFEGGDPMAEDPASAEPGERERGFIPEFVRKMAVAGLGALFMTEEGIRGLSSQLKLPKDALQFVLAQAEKTKDEVGRVLSEELRKFFQSEKLREEFLKVLTGMTVEVKAEVRLVPKPPSSEGSIVPKVTVAELGVRRGRRKRE